MESSVTRLITYDHAPEMDSMDAVVSFIDGPEASPRRQAEFVVEVKKDPAKTIDQIKAEAFHEAYKFAELILSLRST